MGKKEKRKREREKQGRGTIQSSHGTGKGSGKCYLCSSNTRKVWHRKDKESLHQSSKDNVFTTLMSSSTVEVGINLPTIVDKVLHI